MDAQIQSLINAGHDVRVHELRTDDLLNTRSYAVRAASRVVSGVGQNPLDVMRDDRPDVVHVHNLFPNWASRWLKHCDWPVVSTMHNYRPVCASAILWRDGKDCTDCLDHSPLEAVRNSCYRDSKVASIPVALSTLPRGAGRNQIRFSQAIITLNPLAMRIYSDLAGSGKVSFVPNFVKSPVGSRSGKDAGWLFVGRLTAEKGVIELMRSWPASEQLTIVGSGVLDDAVIDASLTNGNITFMGRLGHEKVQQLISNARGLIVPSLWSEGLPTVALEAMAAGTPVVISDNVSSADFLTRGGAGVTYSPKAGRAELQAALSTINRSWSTFSVNAGRRYTEDFSERSWLKSIEKIYEQVVTGA
ncbi:glycosyltransferase family 4 protein [Rhodococcus sp. BP-332]|nr:glycosyltransferase family 4 protein [Rhodococcus sp. BP-332]